MWIVKTINGQRTRLIEVLEGKLEMRAGKHWRQGGHAKRWNVWTLDGGLTPKKLYMA